MRLYVYVFEARGLPPKASGAYAKLQVGKHKSRTRTRTARRGGDPKWDEEFVFRVQDEDDEEEIEVGVYQEDGRGGGDLVGRVQVPVWTVLNEGTQTLSPTWFSLQPGSRAGARSKAKDCGKILVTISLYGKRNKSSLINTSAPHPSFSNSASMEQVAEATIAPPDILHGTDPSTMTIMDRSVPVVEQMQSEQALHGHLADRIIDKNEETFPDVSRNHDLSDKPVALSGDEKKTDGTFSDSSFEEAIEIMQSRDETGIPESLHGGILLGQTYLIEPKDMNSFLFEPNSQFRKVLAEQQGNTDYNEGLWTWEFKDMQSLKRTVTYTKSATKVIKAVKTIEEHTYLKADGKNFAVLVRASTPDVPYGNCFQVDLLYKIMPGPQLSSGEECCQLVISWNMNFYQSTMMKGIIEGTARHGLKESYENFAELLAQYIKPVNSSGLLVKERLLAPLQLDHQSDQDFAKDYFCNLTVISSIFMGLYVLLHIFLSGPPIIQGLELNGLDLPDTFGELFTCGILVLQGERVLYMISRFVQARLQRGCDHGVKAQGDGWLLTVALMEGSNLPSVELSAFSDPYVVFSCNGKTRTSSVQLQTLDPQWNEILEFDAVQEPPSVLDVEVFDFDGPFDVAVSLGHAEINFLKHTSAELADMLVPLDGKLAQTSQSKLHLRIFLENTKGVETIREYLTKMEKEVGKKISLRSPHRNSTFQKLFSLPPEEFLVNDFSCYLKRKMPLQGRLFLSARIMGFYANLFGHKTKFFFLWDDIEDIQIIPPSLATVGSPALLIMLKSGRGMDAQNGAKSLDEEGRLKFQFQAFISFNVASRTIMALWRTKNLTYEQSAKLEEDQMDQGGKLDQIEDTESFLSTEDCSLTKAFSAETPVPMKLLLKLFGGGELERKIMEEVGCLSYSVSQWVAIRPTVEERHINYKFNRHTSIFGGEVSSTQQKTPSVDGNGWIINEVMALHNIPFGNHFRVCLKYTFEAFSSVSSACQCELFIGVTWMKSTQFQKRISGNIYDKLTHRWKEIFELAERDSFCKETFVSNMNY